MAVCEGALPADEAFEMSRLDESWQVMLHDDLLHGLRELLQPENVKVVY